MKVSEMYPSKYLKSEDVGSARITLQVGVVKLEQVEENGPMKPCMYFNGKEKGMVLNKTNALLCAHVWGDDSDQWPGQWLELFVEPKMFQGKVVNGLSVAPKLPNSGTQPLAPPPGEPDPNGLRGDTQPPQQPIDDIPF